MSEGTQNTGDEHAVVGEPASHPHSHEHAVVGEPASHPHQAVVVGEPPENVAPVLGEPAFANGLQDQQPISPPSVDSTSANGFQPIPHMPFHEESSHVSAPSSAPPVDESPNLQQVLAAESGIGESATHQLEAPVAETPGPHVDESASTDAETLVTPDTHDSVCSVEEEPAADVPEVTHIEDIPAEATHIEHIPSEVTHIEDIPAEAPLPEVPTDNPFTVLDEDQTDETASVEILADHAPVIDGAPTANAYSTPDEISSKGLGDQQEEASLSPDVQEKQSMDHLALTQTDGDDEPLEASKAVKEDVHAAEPEQVGQGDAHAQESDSKEANLVEEETCSSVVEHPPAPELDQASERDAFVQENDRSEDIPVESEAASREVEHVLSREVPQSEVSTTELSNPQKDILSENHAAPIASGLQSNEETLVEAPPADFSVAPQGSRAIAVEECVVNQPPAEETYFPPAANGNNGYQHCDNGDCASEREQDLPKDDDDASAEVVKPSSRMKLPLIFTGLAIAAVGVAVASISRPH